MNPDRHTPPDDDPGNPSVDFHGERRSNAHPPIDHRSRGRLARKGAGKEAKLSYAGHVLMENRNGIAVNGCVTQAHRPGGAAGGHGDGGGDPGLASHHAGRGQGLRPQGIRCASCVTTRSPRISRRSH